MDQIESNKSQINQIMSINKWSNKWLNGNQINNNTNKKSFHSTIWNKLKKWSNKGQWLSNNCQIIQINVHYFHDLIFFFESNNGSNKESNLNNASNNDDTAIKVNVTHESSRLYRQTCYTTKFFVVFSNNRLYCKYDDGYIMKVVNNISTVLYNTLV